MNSRTLTLIYLYSTGNAQAGHLIADDYNFSVDHYNNCRLISGYIKSTKLPYTLKDGLKNTIQDTYYLRREVKKNAGEEMNWLNWIPSGGTVVIVQSEKRLTRLEKVFF